ncbi:MAG: type I-U CRISPR-associated RAMP protein Csb1/Cas7u [Terriglobia bacterium]
MAKQLDLTILSDAVSESGVAFRCCVKLQPAGGEGTKVFPPTYAGAVYATEKRRLPGQADPVECVLLDSVQSQANRMEEALQQALDDKRLKVPILEVNFTPYFPGDEQPEGMRLLDPVGKVSSLQAPHRIADAILRDSMLDGAKFRETDIGKRIGMVSARDATALFEHCPTALVFGMWDSTGPKGGLGAKFERAMVAEIVGINAVYGVKTSSRIDPLGILLKAGPLYARSDGTGWTLDESHAKKEKGKPVTLGKDGRPSEANHGNVTPSLSDRSKETDEYLAGGVTISHAEQTVVLSLPALRRLRFPADGNYDAKRDNAARTVLAALGLCAATLAAEAGLDLRSRCLLWPDKPLTWSLLGKPGEAPAELQLDGETAINLLDEAVKLANDLGLPWHDEPVVLTPSDALVKLVVKSQQLAAQQGGEPGEGGD